MRDWLRSLFSAREKRQTQRRVVVVVDGDKDVILIPPPVLAKDQDTDIDAVVEEFIEREGVY